MIPVPLMSADVYFIPSLKCCPLGFSVRLFFFFLLIFINALTVWQGHIITLNQCKYLFSLLTSSQDGLYPRFSTILSKSQQKLMKVGQAEVPSLHIVLEKGTVAAVYTPGLSAGVSTELASVVRPAAWGSCSCVAGSLAG